MAMPTAFYPPPGPPPKHYLPRISRTPSPTLSEYNALNDIKEEKSTKQKIILYGAAALVIGAVVLISVFHEKIINALSPETNWLHDHKLGPVIPIAILIIMSFPPLFGHELVEMICGVTWDLPEAFAIVAVGVLLGEIANFFTFKFCCSARSKKMEKSNLSYDLLAYVVRTGGFLVVLIIRYSAIPPHFATAVFSTVGLGFGVFIAAAVLSLPKAFVPVYVGYALRPSNDDSATSSKVEKIVLIISIGITLFALTWIRRQMNAAKPDVIYLRRKARQGKSLGFSDPSTL
ncbi:hypothetical protein B0H11DRAFT_2018379 [Mycena galericulata]|nr:hypothetical protein B0H11DRAFT_2018379 [Mycena galericulata]